MGKDFSQIVDEIEEHLKKSRKEYYSDFYIGITEDVQRRLFVEHNVSRENSWYITRTAINEDTARKVEKHFLDLGMKGGAGGGTNPTIIYCYEISNNTKQ